MDHAHIEEQGLIDRYFRRDLTGEEEARFEEHYFACGECQKQLAAARDFRRGLRRVAAEDLAKMSAAQRLGVLAWLLRRGRGAQAVILTTALFLAAALPTALFLTRGGAGGLPPSAPAVLLLSGDRSAGEAPKAFASDEPVILALDAGSGLFDHYRIRILEAGGEVVLTADELQPNDLEVLMIAVPAAYFAPGDYRLELEGIDATSASEPLGAYPFRVAR